MDAGAVFLMISCVFFALFLSLSKKALFAGGVASYGIAGCCIFSDSPVIFFLVYLLTVSAGVLFVMFAVEHIDEKRRFKYF